VGVRTGIVRVIADGRMQHRPVLDISSQVLVEGGNRGLLGMTFSPDGAYLYLAYSDRSGADHLASFRFEDGRAVRTSQRTILVVPQPEIVHHGGDLHFDREGDLWMSTGDATLDDSYAGRSQSLSTLLGKLLRIRPTPEAKAPYRVPASNPPGPHREVVAIGLRNPWRFSIDDASGDVWIGDVGQHDREEIDLIGANRSAEANFGWDRVEGSDRLTGDPPEHYVAPLLEYPHTEDRCAVIGGVVYRGEAIAGLQGAYVYLDFCRGELMALVARGHRLAFQQSLHVTLDGVAGFGVDADGELYALSLPYGVFKLVPA
jgi:glucose/arabinose dehydrogenase